MFLTAGVILFTLFTVPTQDDVEVMTTVKATSTTATGKLTESTVKPAESSSSTALAEKLININTASLDELMTLTGIGEVKAKAIINYRETYGPFPSVNALTNVSGIGEKTLSKIADKITT